MAGLFDAGSGYSITVYEVICSQYCPVPYYTDANSGSKFMLHILWTSGLRESKYFVDLARVEAVFLSQN